MPVLNDSQVLAIGARTDNAQLMLDCMALGYVHGFVLDATYGKGRFWKACRPERLITNDIDRSTDADVHRDFRKMPFRTHAFDTVVFDPPYKLNGTSTGRGPSAADADYGTSGAYRSVAWKMNLITLGISECARVAKGHLIVKCQDQVVSGAVVWQTRVFADHAETLGLRLIDMLHVRGYRRQPPGRRQIHARRDYSTALIFVRAR